MTRARIKKDNKIIVFLFASYALFSFPSSIHEKHKQKGKKVQYLFIIDL